MKSVCKDFLSAHGVNVVNTLAGIESPAKTKPIQAYLGAGYRVEASVGYARDLRATKEDS